MKYVILSCSLDQNSFGYTLGQDIQTRHDHFDLITIKECDFGLCDGFDGKAFESPKLLELQKTLETSLGVVIIAPIYNFDVSATCKNIMDLLSKPYKNILTGKSLYHKTIPSLGHVVLRIAFYPPSIFCPPLCWHMKHLFFLNIRLLQKTCDLPTIKNVSTKCCIRLCR